MLPTLTTNLAQAVVACGACVDMPLLSGLPFLVWWMLLFIGWSLLVGPLVFYFTNTSRTTDLRNPAKLFLTLCVVLIVSVFITGGSLMLPFIVVAPFWIGALVSGIRCQSVGWRKFCLCVVGVMLLVIPVSYAFPVVKDQPIHERRANLPRTTPAAPTTAPASPTLRDALPTKPPAP